MPITFTSNGSSIAAVAFSLIYNTTQLGFDDTDADNDGIPDAIAFRVPAAFTGSVPAIDTANGTIQIAIADESEPFAALPDGILATITLSAGTPDATATFPVGFRPEPQAVFTTTENVALPGNTQDGSVLIEAEDTVVALTDVTLTGPTEGVPGTEYTFTAEVSPTDATTPVTYTWTATNRGEMVRTGERTDNIAYTWETPGDKVVNVTATNAAGEDHSATLTLTLEADTPAVVPVGAVTLTGPTDGEPGTEYTFTAEVSPTNATTPITYTWSATQQGRGSNRQDNRSDTISYTWDAPGEKTVTMEAVNAAGEPQTATITIMITEPVVPITDIQLAGPTAGLVGTAYVFTATVSPANATLPITYSWQVSGQETQPRVLNQPSDVLTFTWDNEGVQVLVVEASDSAGNTELDNASITITEPPPAVPITQVLITFPDTIVVGQPATFTATVSPNNATFPITFRWSDALGQSDIGQTNTVNGTTDTVTATWDSAGDKIISVNASNDVPSERSDFRAITVVEATRAQVRQGRELMRR